MFVPIMSAHAKGGTASDTSAAAPRACEVLNGVRTGLNQPGIGLIDYLPYSSPYEDLRMNP
jgi:hypothetical protein